MNTYKQIIVTVDNVAKTLNNLNSNSKIQYVIPYNYGNRTLILIVYTDVKISEKP